VALLLTASIGWRALTAPPGLAGRVTLE
jgi:hypothetical protein